MKGTHEAAGAPPSLSTPTLSICISTLNRADFIGHTLDSFLPQLTDRCEVVVLDNASKDDTAGVVGERARRYPQVRYIRKEADHGLDGNFDKAVEFARGQYCWLLPDDDLVKPGAVEAVLKVLDAEHPSLVLLNYEFRDFTLKTLLQERVLDLESDRVYGAWELERMFVELRDFIRYIGAVVIDRQVWLSRRRDLYNGSHYAFVGMIYQEALPRPVHIVAEPCVSFRSGNTHAYTPKIMEIILAKWPSLIASLPVSRAAKRKLHSATPWRHLHELLFWRGRGLYSMSDYRRWIVPQVSSRLGRLIPLFAATLSPRIANALAILPLYAGARHLRQMDGLKLALLRNSPFYFGKRTPSSTLNVGVGSSIPSSSSSH